MSRGTQSVVIMGEASESEDEDNSVEVPAAARPDERIPAVTPGEAPVPSGRRVERTSSNQTPASHEKPVAKYLDSRPKYNSLLHKKLRERCNEVRKDMTNLVTAPFVNAHKTLGEVNQDVMKDQLIVQDAAAMLRTVTDRLYQLGDLSKNLHQLKYSSSGYDLAGDPEVVAPADEAA